MSYLDPLRLTFFGDFQADVSTVNNDVRHYDNATFEDRFQQPSNGDVENGWWHPIGSNAFRLLACRVRAVHRSDSTTAPDTADDVASRLRIAGSDQAASAKLVDLDPQWQLASQIWGLDVRLVDDDGLTIVRGDFEAAAFRDILFGRQIGAAAVNGQGAAATYQSVLTNVEWAADEVLGKSPFLVQLKQSTAPGFLAIRLATFGYFTRADRPRFTLGKVAGAIGPWQEDQPRSFTAGRRFAPQNGDRTRDGINFFDGRLDTERKVALLDLANAFPLTDPFGTQRDIGPVDLVVLSDDALSEADQISEAQLVLLGPDIPYRQPRWIEVSSGIHAVALSGAQMRPAAQRPWALVTRAPGSLPRVLIRETRGGFHVRAEPSVHRVDSGATAVATAWVTEFGQPLGDAEVLTSWPGPIPGQGTGSPEAPQQPAAPVPDINTPIDALRIPPTIRTDENGRATIEIETRGLAEPRGFLDGQVYMLHYLLPAAPGLVQHQFDGIFMHVRSEYTPPDAPTWLRDVAPLLSQYGNLYPVMEQIVDLSNYAEVWRERAIISLALSLPIEHPNYMPLTRDLSRAKREMILRWLAERNEEGYVLRYGEALPGTPATSGPVSAAAVDIRPAQQTEFSRRLAAAQLLKGAGDKDPAH